MSEVHKISKVIGGPGGGKTTYLLGLIEAAAQKYDPERIGAVSYTNAAINEMKERVAKAGRNMTPESARNIRTIHSHCFRLMEYSKENVVEGAKKIREWNEQNAEYELPIDLSSEKHSEDPSDVEEEEENEKASQKLYYNLQLFKKMNLYRNTMRPYKEWPNDVQGFYRKWMTWMSKRNYVDFTKMLEDALENEAVPDIDVLFVDEAQDTNVLQMKILRQWEERVISTVYVGDSNQAIMRFSGSVPELFHNLNASWRKNLGKSYRCPKKIMEAGRKVLSMYCDDWESAPHDPRDGDDGFISGNMSEPDYSAEGTHMILVRCNFQLAHWRNQLIKLGLPWHNPYRPEDKFMNPTISKLWKAAVIYARLREGDIVTMDELLRMVDQVTQQGNLIMGEKIKAKRSLNDSNYNWMQRVDFRNIGSLGIFTEDFCTLKKPMGEVFRLDKNKTGELIQRVKKNSTFMEKPRFTLGTIHSVKGGESDNVWIDTRTSMLGARMWAQKNEARYDEARVAYVAITRAKKQVGIMSGINKTVGAIPNKAFEGILEDRRMVVKR